MKITGTFIDEISHDIPHQNWGYAEWNNDFKYMKAVGINTVIMIRSGYRRFITYPSKYLQKQYGCYYPPVDLVRLFLELADKHDMHFYFGLYDSGHYWDTNDMQHEIDANRYVIDEVWKEYGHYKSFKGWYLSMEVSRKTKGAVEAFRTLGLQCKQVSNGLPTLISPWIDGKKAVMAASSGLSKEQSISIIEHEKEWSEIFDGITGAVDAVAFQDGHIDYHELNDFFAVNKQMADKFGLQCWTNAESFDRDMPIKFLPIKFEKLRLKLEAARKAGYDKAITFEFSHFMSPQSAYLQAGHLYNRYKDYVSQLGELPDQIFF
ncbi:MAG: Tat pathway signal protein [Ferruginibacter sp.]|nr:Tat pathway signal protein [Ferruginibacter sp.]